MDVRTFSAFSIKDAVKKIKAEFGHDAVILSTRNIDEKNGKIEVTAAAPVESSSLSRGALSWPQEDLAAFKGRFDGIDLKLANFEENTPSKKDIDILHSGLQELKLLLLEQLRNKEGSTLKSLNTELIPIERQLSLMGVDEVLISQLLSSVAKEDDQNTSSEEQSKYFRGRAMRWLMKQIKISAKWALIEGSPIINLFVGFPGVGKTSLIAKLASYYSQREKRKCLLLSYELGTSLTSGGLEVIAKILGTPHKAIYEPKDLEQVLTGYNNCEVVFIDVCGCQPRDGKHLKLLKALKHLPFPIDTHLVLSMTERQELNTDAVKAFSHIGVQSIAFTKLDNSWRFGDLVNIPSKWSLPISFLSNGQEIPEGLERATKEKIIERIFGL